MDLEAGKGGGFYILFTQYLAESAWRFFPQLP